MKAPSRIKTLFMAARPSSFIMTLTPVLLGTVMAWGDGIQHLPTAIVALFGGIMIHAGTNLTNDYYDFLNGADKEGDFDPMRGNLVGDVPLKMIGWAAVLCFLLLVPPAFYLINRGGWPVILIAVLSVLAGIFYTAGRHPLAYIGGFGDLFVLIFFGPVALAGTYYVQSLEMNAAVALAGLAPGLFAVGVLTINNIRDIEKDKAVGKKTLAVRFGKKFGTGEFLSALFSIILVPVAIHALIRDHAAILWSTLIVYPAMPLIRDVLTKTDTASYNKAIGATIRLLMIYVALFSIGWVI